MSKSFLGQTSLARGIRNNNPGNIVVNANNKWLGKITPSSDVKFEQFQDVHFGLRAMMVLLRNYVKQGNNTISKIITKYAPTTENHTSAYINSVVSQTGFSKDALLNLDDKTTLISLSKAIVFVENGKDYNKLNNDDYETAYRLLSSTGSPISSPPTFVGNIQDVAKDIFSKFGNVKVETILLGILTIFAVFF